MSALPFPITVNIKKSQLEKCQRNVKKCKRMSHAFERIIRLFFSAELELEKRDIGMRKIREELMRSFTDDF